MLTTPTLHEVVEGPRGMLRGIEAALDAQCMVSAVMLCYGMIDALAALSRREGSERLPAPSSWSGLIRTYCRRRVSPAMQLTSTAHDAGSFTPIGLSLP